MLILSFFALLSACGGGKSSPSAPASREETTLLNSFLINGTTSANNTSAITLNPAVNSGVFKIEWDVSLLKPYHIDLYLSSDPFLNGATVINIFEHDCSRSGENSNCDLKAKVNCKYTSNNYLSCATKKLDNKNIDISSFLNTIPKDAYLVLEVCNSNYSSCELSSNAVVLQ